MTKRLQTLLGQIAIDDTQRTKVREEALACVEWLREEEATTREDAARWTHLIEGLKHVPLVSPHCERVREFMERAGQDTPLEYTPLDEPTRILRAKLILEEALETIRELGIIYRRSRQAITDIVMRRTWKHVD